MTLLQTQFVSMTKMLADAKAEQYAVAQINMNSLQWIQAILEGAEEMRAPIIIAASDRIVDFLGGFSLIVEMVKSVMIDQQTTVPVCLHLDHGQTVERCIAAIDAGFSSVMIDGSHYSIEENIAMTKAVTAYATGLNVSVEAEVGTVGGNEDGLIGGIQYANPDECVQLVKEANIDALAAALGSVHGPYKGEPKLGFEEMAHIATLTNIPLVLHGGSGIPLYQIQKAIALGHAKINVNTECLMAWTETVRELMKQYPNLYDVPKILTAGRQAVKSVVIQKIIDFGSHNRI